MIQFLILTSFLSYPDPTLRIAERNLRDFFKNSAVEYEVVSQIDMIANNDNSKLNLYKTFSKNILIMYNNNIILDVEASNNSEIIVSGKSIKKSSFRDKTQLVYQDQFGLNKYLFNIKYIDSKDSKSNKIKNVTFSDASKLNLLFSDYSDLNHIFDFSGIPYQKFSEVLAVTNLVSQNGRIKQFFAENQYGEYTIICESDFLKSIDIIQLPHHRLRSDEEGLLSEHVGDLSDSRGYDSIQQSFNFTYNRDKLKSIIISAKFTSGSNFRSYNTNITFKNRIPIDSQNNFDEYIQKIPDGTPIQPMDESLQNLSFVVKDGKIVRKVDGAALDVAIAQVERKSRLTTYALYIAGALFVVLTLVIVRFILKRRTA